MTTPSQIEDAVGDWLAAAMPARVLVRGRIGESPAPASPYLLYWLENIQTPDSQRAYLAGGEQHVEAVDSRLEFIIETIGDRATQTARDDALRLSLSLRESQRTGDLFALCGLWSVGQMQNLSAVETGTHRQRMRFVLILSATLAATSAEESIGSVETGIFEGTIPAEQTLQTMEP